MKERKHLNTPAFWDEESKKELVGTSLEERIDGLNESMQEEFDKLIVPFFKENALKLDEKASLDVDLFKVYYFLFSLF